jgi:uncharacterized protein involved in exopolysaccharide biosynthesis
MIFERFDRPRRLLRLWAIVRDGLPALGRYRRYALAIWPFFALIWAVTIGYIVFTPSSYTSHMTLILPGSGVGGSMNVETLGQATTTTASAFSSPTLSPTENYKRLIGSDNTLAAAAARVGINPASFPKPTIKLTDQTNLIEVQLNGPSAREAAQRLNALRSSFLGILDTLRADEARTREQADRRQIAALQEKARTAQRAVLAFQGRTGIVSIDQFNARVAALDTLNNRAREAEAQAREQAATTSYLARALKVSVTLARRAMILRADPIFQTLLTRYATIATDSIDRGAVLGDHHVTIEELDARRADVRDALLHRGAIISGLPPRTLLAFTDLAVDQGRGQLMVSLVNGASQSAGARANLAAIRDQLAAQSRGTDALVSDAATLSDLLRDQRVAEAVFSSALARLDTNKADPFASYPLVQTFEAPSLPTKRTSPSPKLAIAGAIGASLLTLVGFLLLWLRQPIIRKLLPKS